MNPNRLSKIVVSFVFIFSLLACSLSLPGLQATATLLPPPATQVPAATATSPAAPTVAPTTAPTQAPTTAPTQQPPTATTKPTATPKPTNTAKPTNTPIPGARGFALFDKAKGEVRGYDLSTKAQIFKYVVTGEDTMGFGTSQMVGETLYYFAQSEQKVITITKTTATKLNFIPKETTLVFAVSTDGKKIAWAFDNFDQQNPGSELWVAGIDGSGAKKVASIAPADNSKWLVLRPYKWLPDGRLLYTQNPTGIGGYILFYGFGGISVYNPANSAKPTAPLLDASKPAAGFLCLEEISPDLKNAITECGTKTQGQLSLDEISSGKLTPIPILPEQTQAGSPLYSPSGAWLAYAVARGHADNEAGKVAILPAAGGQPKVIASFGNGYVQVAGWIDENTLLLESFQSDQPTLWTIQRDSSGLVKVGDGYFVGLIK